MPTQDNVLLETDDSLKEWFEKEIEIKRKVFKEWLEKKEKEIKEINFNSDTKEMSIVYSDGSIKKYFGFEITHVSESSSLGNEKTQQVSITYNFSDFNNEGKYVEDFGGNNE
jgi:magnesium-transporting ATPase (P-type)